MSRRSLVLPLATFAVAVMAVVLPAEATPPGANGKLLFERPTQDGADLYTVGADGSGPARLTRLRGVEGDASWSPDGSKVAFTRSPDPERGPFEIWVVDADGGGLTRLTRHRGFSFGPAWSPEGEQVVYSTDAGKERPPGLHVAAADGSSTRRLARGRGDRGYGDPSWSPDGTTIAFAILRPGANQRQFDSSLAVVDADGSGLRRLTPAGGPDELNPNWSPDGGTIAFERNRRFDLRQSDIWVMAADGSGARAITSTPVHETNPTFAPDGTRIGFSSDRDNRQLSKGRLGRGFDLYTMALDGSDTVRVTENRRPDLFPDWQPVP